MKCIIVDDGPMAAKVFEHHVKQTDFREFKKSFNLSIEALTF